MSFTETDHPRETDGKFAEKTGAAPEVVLGGGNKELMLNDLQNALNLLDNPNFENFPLAMQERAIAAVNDRNADEDVLYAADEVAKACESWNFHDTAMKLWAGIGRKRHADNPDAPIDQAYSVAYDPATPTDLLYRVRDENGGALTYAFLNNKNAPADIIDPYESGSAYVRQLVAGHPNASTEVLTRLADDGTEYVRDAAKANLADRGRSELVENWDGRRADELV